MDLGMKTSSITIQCMPNHRAGPANGPMDQPSSHDSDCTYLPRYLGTFLFAQLFFWSLPVSVSM